MKFELLTVEHGLSQSACIAIAQDSLGFMLFGTQEGVNRYDGHSFKVYRAFQKPDNGLSNHHIGRIIVDRKGKPWVATRFGLNLYNRQTDKSIPFFNDPDDSTSLNPDNIYTFFEDKTGTLWVGTRAGLNRFRWEDSSFVRYEYNPDNPNSVGEGSIYSIAEDYSGNILIGTSRGGLNKFDPERGTFTRFNSANGSPAKTMQTDCSFVRIRVI